jgi:hypothetical protein
MTLIEAIQTAKDLPDDMTILATKPWSCDSSIHLIPCEDLLSTHPHEIEGLTYHYFLEVDIFRDVVEGLLAINLPAEHICARVIHYATHDA